MYIPIEADKKIAMPRYYKDRIYSEQERLRLKYLGAITANERLLQFEKAMYENYGDKWMEAKAASDLHAQQKMRADAIKNRKL